MVEEMVGVRWCIVKPWDVDAGEGGEGEQYVNRQSPAKSSPWTIVRLPGPYIRGNYT